MRFLSIVLLTLAGFFLYVAASGSLAGIMMAWHGRFAATGLVIAIVAWIPFALFLALGLVCSRRGEAADRAAITVLLGALLTLMVWLSVGLMLVSPDFTALLPRRHNYLFVGRVALFACPALLLLIVPAGMRARTMSRRTGRVTTAPQ